MSGIDAPLCLVGGYEIPRTYTADVLEPAPGFPGLPPYTYEWRWNTDGNFTAQSPGNLISTNSEIEINSVLSCPWFFLRLTVTSSDGRKESVTRVIETEFCQSCNKFLRGSNATSEDLMRLPEELREKNTDLPSRYVIYPNPTSSKITIERPDGFPETFRIKVYDAYQRKLLEIFTENEDFVELDLKQYSGQLVWIHIQDKETAYVHKVVIIED